MNIKKQIKELKFCECCGQEIEEELPKPNPNFKLVSRFEETKENKG